MPAATGSLHHIDITVTDLERSTQFYHQVLPLLGWERRPDAGEVPLWAADRSMIALQRAHRESLQTHDRYAPGLHHLAFSAPDRAAVDRVYRELQRLGVNILDPPALYEQYAPGYYAVFFSDPDGIKLEYVFTPVWPT